jgi:hypothetical protein
MVMQGSKASGVVTKFEIIKTKDDIQVQTCDPVLSTLMFHYCIPALCPSFILEEGASALLSTKKYE